MTVQNEEEQDCEQLLHPSDQRRLLGALGIEHFGDGKADLHSHEMARELNAGIRQLGKEPGTVEVLLPSSGAKVVANLRGELLTFEIGDFHTFVRQSGLW